MEDYQSAFLQRHQDTEILFKSHRKIAAMHFGGITIECLLKSMILASVSSVIKWINIVENPSQNFIDMRYSSSEPNDDKYKEWLSAYTGLKQWLQKQATQL